MNTNVSLIKSISDKLTVNSIYKGVDNPYTEKKGLVIISDKGHENHNSNWFKDWMEQASHYKNNPEAMKLIANDIEGFCHYIDIVESK